LADILEKQSVIVQDRALIIRLPVPYEFMKLIAKGPWL